jgi:CRP-like cAMP-binding protein
VTAVEVLACSDVFGGLAGETVGEIAAISREVRYPPGAFVYRIGDRSADLFLLAEGAVALSVRPLTLETARGGPIDAPGQVFGWGAVAGSTHYRIRNAMCVRETRLVAIGGTDLLRLLEQRPAVGFEVLRRLLGVILTEMIALAAT